MEDLYPWIVVAHVLGALLFALAHGVSVLVAFSLRPERDPIRIRAFLDLSGSSLGLTYGGLLVLLLAGIVAGVAHGWFAYAWPWVAIVILVLIAILMSLRGSMYYAEVRHAVGLRSFLDKPDAPTPKPASPEALARLLATRRPEELAVEGGLGLAVLVWLMVAKPF